MYIVNGEHADVQNKFIVGAGGVTKGDFVVGPSTAIVKGAGGVNCRNCYWNCTGNGSAKML